MKNFFRAAILAIILFGAYGLYRVMERPITLYPYPYIIKNTSYNDKEQAENSNILIIGDRMAQELEKIKPSLLKELSKDFSTDLIIYNWAEENEGLHRTLDKLSSLKKYPQIIIYQGGSREFYEEKFNLNQNIEFEKNLAKYRDPSTISLIQAYPFFSKFIYSFKNLTQLGPDIKRAQGEKPAEEIQKIFEMGYKIFDLEMDQLVKMAKEKNFSLFLVTTPLNLKIAPKEICSNASSETLDKEQMEISNLLKQGKSKEAFERISLLGNSIQGNARNYYLLGMALENMGNFKDAALALNEGSVFDCHPWRSNIVFNNIIRTKINEKNIYMIDFDKIVNQNFGIRDLFQDEIYPKKEFYDLLGSEMAPMIGQIFKR